MKPWKDMTVAERRAAWCVALRSGVYRQTKECLRDSTGHCCLGVACDVAFMRGAGEWRGDTAFTRDRSNEALLPPPLRDDLGLACDQQDTLADTNDSGTADFLDIAKLIEALPLP